MEDALVAARHAVEHNTLVSAEDQHDDDCGLGNSDWAAAEAEALVGQQIRTFVRKGLEWVGTVVAVAVVAAIVHCRPT